MLWVKPGRVMGWGVCLDLKSLRDPIFVVQVGESDIVLEAGQKALDMKEAKPFRSDVLLSMALAQCSLAAQAFDTKDEVSTSS